MTGVETVGSIVEILVSGITQFGTGLAQGIGNFVQNLAYTGSGDSQTLSVYFVLVLVFAAVAICTSITTRIFQWITNLGN